MQNFKEMKLFLTYILVMGCFFSNAQTFDFQYDPNGNQATKTIEGTVSEAAIQGPETFCFGDSLELTAIGGVSYQWSSGTSGNTIVVSPEATSTYRVTVTDENGCPGIASHVVEVLPQPEPFAIEGDLTGFSGSAPNVYAIDFPVDNSTYFWSVEGGYLLSGFGTPEIEVVWQTDSIGYVHVVEQNEAGCFGDTISQEITIVSRQVISLDAGWNLISTYLELADNSPEAAFSELGDNLVKVKNIEEVYDPGAPDIFNTLTEILPGQGYWIKVQSATELAFLGRPVDPYNTPIHMAAGWNLIGYTWNDPQSVEHAFEPIEAELEKVKDIFSSYDPTLPPIFNTLITIEPGKGYWVNVSQATTLYFPAPDEDPMAPLVQEKLLTHPKLKYDPASDWSVVAYSNSTIAYGWATLNDKPIDEGVMIGAFVDNECRGLAKVTNHSDTSYVSFVINGEVEEAVEFHMAYQGKRYTSNKYFNTQPGVPFTYLLPIRFYDPASTNSHNTSEDIPAFQVFPNPFSDKIILSFFLPRPSFLTVRILDQKGRALKNIQDGWLLPGSHTYHWKPKGSGLAAGVYLVQFQGENFNVLKKITYQK